MRPTWLKPTILIVILSMALQAFAATDAPDQEQELLPPLPDIPTEGAPVDAEKGPSTIEIMGDAFFDTFIKELLKDTLNNQIKDITISGASYAVGDVALAVISAAQAGKDWDEAETDSQKFYAGSRFVTAVLGPYTGGVSSLIGLAITGNELFYRVGVADVHERAAEYAREAAESLARSEAIFTGLARAEYEQLRLLVNSRAALKKSLSHFDDTFREKCTKNLQSLRELDGCLVILEAQVLTVRRLIDLDLKLISFNGSFISMGKIFKQQEVDWDQTKIKLQDSIEKVSGELQAIETLVSQIIIRKWTLLDQLIEQNLKEMDSLWECEKYALGVSRAFQEIRFDQALAEAEELKIDLEILNHHMDQLISGSKEKLNECGVARLPLPKALRQRLVP